MIEQWKADYLLAMSKVYSGSLTVDLSRGAQDDYAVESDDGTEHFLLDVWTSARNPRKARFQLRYRREVKLARMCTAVPHTNPDGNHIDYPHFHRYTEADDDRWAESMDPIPDIASALQIFCKKINLPAPEIQGGLT